MFPSPIGELHFSMIDGKDENGNDKSFRPLSGSYISQLFRSKQLTLFQKKVSVPYRGATFLNPGFGSSYSILAIKVSVPYRGATFLNATPQ